MKKKAKLSLLFTAIFLTVTMLLFLPTQPALSWIDAEEPLLGSAVTKGDFLTVFQVFTGTCSVVGLTYTFTILRSSNRKRKRS